MKIYEPIAIALVSVLVLASVFILGKHSGYQEAVAQRNIEIGLSSTKQDTTRSSVNGVSGNYAITQ